nr:MAG TPA: hypothetical protein [Caudoviricetes sp.]
MQFIWHLVGPCTFGLLVFRALDFLLNDHQRKLLKNN